MNDDLLIKFLLKETSEAENKEIQEWMANIDNVHYFRQLEKIWNESALLAQKNEVDEELAWQKFKHRVDQKVDRPIVRKIGSRYYSWLRIAAVFVLIAGVWTAYKLLYHSNYIDFATHLQVVNKELPDGTKLVVNKNTEISYANDFEQHRDVQLKKGEVFFEVAHDKVHPFMIKMGKVSVEVVGTSFNIKYDGETAEVIVESGIVKVANARQKIQLVKGESISVGKGIDNWVKQPTENDLYNYYRTKLFIANNTPLTKLVEVLNEAYGAHVVLAEDVKGLKIFTTLPFNSLDKNLQNICEVLDLKMVRNQTEILLSKK